VAITSGGLELVADKGGGDNSPFAKAFIDAIRDNGSNIDGAQLFTKMRRPVMVAADQTPRYSDVRQAGGDFLFVRKRRRFWRKPASGGTRTFINRLESVATGIGL
jgi:hypothetical protein